MLKVELDLSQSNVRVKLKLMEKVEKAKQTHGEKMEEFGKNMWSVLISKDNVILFAIFSTNGGNAAWKRTQRCWGKKSGKKGDGPKISIFATSGHFQCVRQSIVVACPMSVLRRVGYVSAVTVCEKQSITKLDFEPLRRCEQKKSFRRIISTKFHLHNPK